MPARRTSVRWRAAANTASSVDALAERAGLLADVGAGGEGAVERDFQSFDDLAQSHRGLALNGQPWHMDQPAADSSQRYRRAYAWLSVW